MAIVPEHLEELQERIRRAPADLIAARLKRARKTSDLRTLDNVAAAVGTSRQHLIKLEKGQHRPGAAMLTRYAEATGRQVEWFLDPEIDPSPFDSLDLR